MYKGRYETGNQLILAGVGSGFEMTVEAALAKVMLILGHDHPVEKVKELMCTPLAGEMITEPIKE